MRFAEEVRPDSSPLPTVGCRSCTTCLDTTPPTCGSPSSDPKSCGTCPRDKVVCPVGVGQLAATCTNGKCRNACDTANGYTGADGNCSKPQVYLSFAHRQPTDLIVSDQGILRRTLTSLVRLSKATAWSRRRIRQARHRTA